MHNTVHICIRHIMVLVMLAVKIDPKTGSLVYLVAIWGFLTVNTLLGK